jgi:excinuclease ABC subunit C
VPIDPEALSKLATRPGVYLFRDARREVLYVGKAKALRPRVRSYFQREADLSAKNRELMRHVDGLETIVVGSEAEALILEANLIKEHRPRFNILLRDDKLGRSRRVEVVHAQYRSDSRMSMSS